MSAHGVIRSSPTSAHDREHRRRTFLRHLLEMIIAMMLPLEMALMIPAMIGVMAVRYDEYATHAPAHSTGSTPRLVGS